MAVSEKALEALLTENRKFPPGDDFAEAAVAGDPTIYEKAAADPEGFWAAWATQLDWFEPFDQVLSWEPPYAKCQSAPRWRLFHTPSSQ